MRPKLIIIITVALAVVAAVGFVVLKPPAETSLPPVLTLEEGEYLYTYHVLSGTEALFQPKDDPHLVRNLARQRPDDALALRLKLSRNLGVTDLPDIRERRTDLLRQRLVSLGYLR